MKLKKRNPAAGVTASRALSIEVIGVPFDASQDMSFASESPAARHILRHHPVSRQKARLVAELSGLGVRYE